jgi:hypothetical protein
MPIGADKKIDYQTLEVNRSLESWLASGLSGQPKIVAFISPGDDLGMTALLSDVAAAISALDKRVNLVLDVKDDESPGDIELLREISDYLLVDLPSRPTPFARSVLLNCDLIIVASSCKIEFLSEVENVIKALLFLGIDTEKVAGVLVDPEGILSSASLAGIKPYLEASLGVEMAGVVSYESGSGSRTARDIEQLARYIMPRDLEREAVISGAS